MVDAQRRDVAMEVTTKDSLETRCVGNADVWRVEVDREAGSFGVHVCNAWVPRNSNGCVGEANLPDFLASVHLIEM